jgi:hypothetical protein
MVATGLDVNGVLHQYSPLGAQFTSHTQSCCGACAVRSSERRTCVRLIVDTEEGRYRQKPIAFPFSSR